VKKRNCLFLFIIIFQSLQLLAKDYPASLFGIASDGITMNTRSIQAGIDYISANGGGRLVFSVGRYLSGSIHLKSNVTLHLAEGAVLVGSTNPYDYDKKMFTAFILAYDQSNIGISGRGGIDGRGREVAKNLVQLIHGGVIQDELKNDRPQEDKRPMVINFRSCNNVIVQGVTIQNSASWVQTYDQCKNLKIDSITVNSKAFWNNDGIDIVDCENASVTNSYIDAADDGICLKSHDDKAMCNDILLRNNTIRSSANAIKFGTISRGGFKNIRIISNKVFDTYRSAIALEAVDGGFIENIDVDSLQVFRTGNVIFLRVGERWGEKTARMNKVSIRNVYAEIPATKPDAGYEYEGPVEDMPRNVSPAIIIAGLPNKKITGVTITNVTIKHPGGGNPMFAQVGLTQLDSIPELPAKYPDFSMFKELPAWGIYVRHAQDLQFNTITLTADKDDYRLPIVLDDVHKANLLVVTANQPNRKKLLHLNKSTDITTK
jgi:hypothetical protein